MSNLYPIENTKNLHKEQLSGAYLDNNFWPNFQETLNNFKNMLIKKVNNKEAFSLLRVGHSELSAFYIALNSNKRVGNFLGRQSNNRKIPDETIIKMFKSVINSNYISTQIGYDFIGWMREILGFIEFYKKINNEQKFLENKKECLNYKIEQQSPSKTINCQSYSNSSPQIRGCQLQATSGSAQKFV